MTTKTAAPAVPVTTARHRARKNHDTARARHGLLFVTPTMVWIAVFHLLPLLFGLGISLFQYRIVTPAKFVGVRNYAQVLTDPTFQHSLWITALYIAGTVVVVWVFAFAVALGLHQRLRAKGLWRTLIFLPTVVPTITIALLWIPLLNGDGPINALLRGLHLPAIGWLTSVHAAPWAIIVLSWWQATSYYTFMFLSGLQALPVEPLESAAIDGANAWQRFRYIVAPAMRRTFTLVVVVSILNALQTFVFQNVVTAGGPADATQIITLLVYRTAFEYLDMGRAAAMAVILFAITLLVSLTQLRVLRGGDGD